MSKRRFYTPDLHEQNVRRLYQMAQKFHMPMSKLLNLIVSVALEDLDNATEGEDTLCTDFAENALTAVMAPSQNRGIHRKDHLAPVAFSQQESVHHEHV